MIIFIFSLSRPFPTCFSLKGRHNGIFLFFEFFCYFFAIFLEFSITQRVGTERNGTIIFIFSLSRSFLTCFGFISGQNLMEDAGKERK